MADINRDDIAAMRKEGDLRNFLRSLARAPREKPPAPPPEPPEDPGYTRPRPGAWPDGTSPPGPVEHPPGTDWGAALEDYRAWFRATYLDCDDQTEGAGA